MVQLLADSAMFNQLLPCFTDTTIALHSTEILEETELKKRTGLATQEHRTQIRDEGVTITELSTEDIGTTETDSAVVTQPEDDVRGIRVVEEKTEQHVQTDSQVEVKKKKKTAVRKVIKAASEEEEVEIEVEIVGGGKRKVKKTIRAHQPDEDEEIFDEDTVGLLKRKESMEVQGLPLYEPSSVALTVPSEMPAELLTGRDVPQERVKVSMLTHVAFTEQEVKSEEREQDKTQIVPQGIHATPAQEVVEHLAVTQPHVQATPGEFDKAFRPQSYEASQTLVQNESIVVSETVADQSTVATKEVLKQETRASVALIPNEAASVMEIEASDKENIMESPKQPTQLRAERTIGTKEGLSVTEITEGLREDSFDGVFKPATVKPKFDFMPNESVLVSEVSSETKPGKFVPELIVPTETATKSVSVQQPLTTDMMQAPELEGDFFPGRLPPSQKANKGVTPVEAAITSDLAVQEKEGDLASLRRPDQTHAVQDIATLEGVVVSSTQAQDSESTFTSEAIESKTVDIAFFQQQSVITYHNTSAEKEDTFIQGEVPDSKTAVTTISCLETSGVVKPIGLEVEGEFVPDQSPSVAVAETSIREEQPISIIEIQTNDVPSEFADILRYRTDEASSTMELIEAKEVTEVLLQDKESTLEVKDKPSPCSVETGYRHQFGVSIFEAFSGEKEEKLEVYDLPDSHKGKMIPTHPVVSLQVEETSAEDSTADFKKTVPQSETANTGTDTFQETVVQEAVVGEGTINYEADLAPASKYADVVVLEKEATTRIEVFTQDKEGTYSLPTEVKECYALTDISGQKLAVKSEVTPEDSATHLDDELPKPGYAKSEQSTLDSIVISQSQLVEKEGLFINDTLPDLKTAFMQLPDELIGVAITNVQPHEAESEYIPSETPKSSTASPSVPSREVAIQYLVHSEHSAVDLQQETPLLGRAKTESQPLSELIVTETAVAETEQDFKLDSKPSSHTAIVSLSTNESISLTETVPDSKEDAFVAEQTPKLRKASVDVLGHEVAQKIETVIDQQLGDWKRVSPVKEIATPGQDGLQLPVLTQMGTSEMEGDYPEHVKPDEHTAGIMYEDASQVVSISEIQLGEKEHPLTPQDAPKQRVAVPDVQSQGVAQTNIVISEGSTGEIEDVKPDLVKAKADQMPFETVSIMETQPVEIEDEYSPHSRPEGKTALTLYQEEESVSVSMTTAQENEVSISDFEKPVERTAVPHVSGHEIAQSSEIFVGASIGDLSVALPASVIANIDQDTLHSIMFTETATGYKEGTLLDDVKPDSKMVEISYEQGSSILVSETIPQDKEVDYDGTLPVESRYAKPNISGHEVATKTEVMTESVTEDIPLEVEKGVRATADHVPFQSVVSSLTTADEHEGDFTGKIKLDEQKASPVFQEEKSVHVFEVTVEDRESSLQPAEIPSEKVAEYNFSTKEVAVNAQVCTEIGLGDFVPSELVKAQAHPEHLTVEGLVLSEAIVNESETEMSAEKKKAMSHAELAIDENLSLEVSTIEIGDKESAFLTPCQPKLRTAQPDVTVCETATQLITVAESSTKQFESEKAVFGHAHPDQQPHESILMTETALIESEEKLEKTLKTDTHHAELEYEAEKTVVVSEITLAEKEIKYESPDLPKGRSAVPNLTETQEVAESIQVESTLATAELQKPNIQQDVATAGQETLQHIQVSQDLAQEQETEFSGKFKPTSKSASVYIEEGKSVQVVSTVETGDKEEPIGEWQAPVERKALPDISGHEIAQKSEVLTEMCVGEVSTLKANTITATVDQAPFYSIQQSEAHPSEKEVDFTDAPMFTSSTAETSFEERKGLEVTFVTADDKESVYEIPEKPKERVAQPDVLPKEVAETSTVITEHSIKELSKPCPTSARAKTEHLTFESIELTESVVAEQEQDFTGAPKTTGTNANIALQEVDGVCITMIESHDKEDILSRTEMPTTRKAQPEILGQEVAQSCIVRSEVAPGPVEVKSTKEGFATVEQTTFEPFVQQETLVQEAETEFPKESMPISRIADLLFEEGTSLRVSQVVPEDREDTLEIPEAPKLKSASADIISQEGVVVTAVDSQMHSVEKDEPFVLKLEKAYPEQEQHEALIVSEGLLQEREGEVVEGVRPTTKNAGINFVEGKSAITSEVVPEYKEEDRAPDIVPLRKAAPAELSGQEVAEKSEILVQDATADLETPKVPRAFAVPEQPTLEALLQSQPIVSEKEGEFLKEFRADFRSADIGMECGQSAAVAYQVIPEDKESPYASTDEPHLQKAKLDILGRDVAEKTVIVTGQTAGDVVVEALPSKGLAQPQQIPYETTSQTETIVNESEDTFQVSQQPDAIKADLKFQTDKSLTVTEVVAQDKEGFDLSVNVGKEEVASPDVSERQTATQSITIPQSSAAPFSTEAPNVSQAKMSMPQQVHGLLVTEHRSTGEMEAQLPALVTPASKTIPFSIEERETNLVVTEVLPEDREGEYTTTYKLPEHQVKVDLDALHIGMKEEVVPDSSFAYTFTKTARTLETADVKISRQEAITVTDLNPSEIEMDMTNTPLPETKIASVSCDTPQTGINVCEHTCLESSGFIPQNLDETESGKVKVLAINPLQSDEVYASEYIGNLKPHRPSECSGVPRCNEQQSLLITTPLVRESEENFTAQFDTNEHHATDNVCENRSYVVSETISQHATTPASIHYVAIEKYASPNILAHQPTNVESVMISHTCGKATSMQTMEEIHVFPQVMTQSSISVQEVTASEGTDDFIVTNFTVTTQTDSKLDAMPVAVVEESSQIESTSNYIDSQLANRSARLLVEPVQPIITTSISPDEHPTYFDSSANTGSEALAKIDCQFVASTAEVVLSGHARDFNPSVMTSTAKHVVSTVGAAAIDEVVLAESTTVVDTKGTEGDTYASSAFLAHVAASTEETLPEEYLMRLMAEQLRSNTATCAVFPLQARVTEEAVIESSVSDISQKRESINFIAKPCFDTPCIALKVDENQSFDSTADVTEQKNTFSSCAEMEITTTQAAVTENTFIQDNVRPMAEFSLQPEVSAEPGICQLQAAVVENVGVLEEIVILNLEDKPSSVKAQSDFEAIQVPQCQHTVPEESLRSLKPECPGEQQIANFDISSQMVAAVTDIKSLENVSADMPLNPRESQASVNVVPHLGAIAETIVSEQIQLGKVWTDTKPYCKATGNVVPQHIAAVNTPFTGISVKRLPEQLAPEKLSAEPTLLPHIALEVNKTELSESLGPHDIAESSEVRAHPSVLPQNVFSTELQLVQDSESELTVSQHLVTNTTPVIIEFQSTAVDNREVESRLGDIEETSSLEQKANIGVSLQQAICTQETLSELISTLMKKTHAPTEEKATVKMDTNVASMTQEVSTSHNISPLLIEKTSDGKALREGNCRKADISFESSHVAHTECNVPVHSVEGIDSSHIVEHHVTPTLLLAHPTLVTESLPDQKSLDLSVTEVTFDSLKSTKVKSSRSAASCTETSLYEETATLVRQRTKSVDNATLAMAVHKAPITSEVCPFDCTETIRESKLSTSNAAVDVDSLNVALTFENMTTEQGISFELQNKTKHLQAGEKDNALQGSLTSKQAHVSFITHNSFSVEIQAQPEQLKTGTDNHATPAFSTMQVVPMDHCTIQEVLQNETTQDIPQHVQTSEYHGASISTKATINSSRDRRDNPWMSFCFFNVHLQSTNS